MFYPLNYGNADKHSGAAAGRRQALMSRSS
ncbi:MAG: hypothetical protein RL105_1202 [Verrucomicrobiota bacterium]|jgi:hypothetical protein